VCDLIYQRMGNPISKQPRRHPVITGFLMKRNKTTNQALVSKAIMQIHPATVTAPSSHLSNVNQKMKLFAMHQLVDDPVRTPDPAFFILIMLVVPFVTWSSVRRNRRLGYVALTLAILSTAYVISSLVQNVRGGGYLNSDGPDYIYLSLAFIAGALPWIVARLAYTLLGKKPCKPSEPTATNSPPSATPPAPLPHR